MRFCPVCNRSMEQVIVDETLRFVCACGEEQPSTPLDLHIEGEVLYHSEVLKRYKNFIKWAPFDPVNTFVKKDCTNCGLDFMAQLRLSEDEIIVYVCRCGATLFYA